MSRIYRVISTFLVVSGLGFLCFYTYTESAYNKFFILRSPSYYVLKNYWYIFLAGIMVLFFSIIGSFFSWFKGIEEKEEILPNAGYSSKKDIAKWVDGSSLDTAKTMEESMRKDTTQHIDIPDRLVEEDKTVIRTEADRTEVVGKEDRAEVHTERQTEMQEEKR